MGRTIYEVPKRVQQFELRYAVQRVLDLYLKDELKHWRECDKEGDKTTSTDA